MRNDSLLPLVDEVEAYLAQYVAFADPSHKFAVALWLIGTYLWYDLFDTCPYLVITSATKRSGKTRLAELVSKVAANPRWLTGGTAPTMFYMIRDEMPTVLVDEAERLSGESANLIREALNAGYRRGQTIPRMGEGKKVEHWPVYCPKVFVLIGDVNDTLRDRSIVIRMRRGLPEQMDALARYVDRLATLDGNALGLRIKEETEDVKAPLMQAFEAFEGLPFLSDRDEELWTPLFILCQQFAPERVAALRRIAVDLSTEKTADARDYSELQDAGAEDQARDDEYAGRLLKDLLVTMNGEDHVYTADALNRLRALDTAPWRKYRGDEGLTAMMMASLLSRHGVATRAIQRRKLGKVARGYRRVDVERALKAM